MDRVGESEWRKQCQAVSYIGYNNKLICGVISYHVAVELFMCIKQTVRLSRTVGKRQVVQFVVKLLNNNEQPVC